MEMAMAMAMTKTMAGEGAGREACRSTEGACRELCQAWGASRRTEEGAFLDKDGNRLFFYINSEIVHKRYCVIIISSHQ